MVHSATTAQGVFTFKSNYLEQKESGKNNTYFDLYRSATYAFCPLLMDAYGHIGSHALRFFRKVGIVAAQLDSSHSSSVMQPFSATRVFRACISRFLCDGLEAQVARIREFSPAAPRSSDVDDLLPSTHSRQHSAASAPSSVLASVPLLLQGPPSTPVEHIGLELDLDSSQPVSA